MPAKNNHAMIRPLSFLSLEELRYAQGRLPNSLPARLSTLFLVDTRGDTYFLLDMAALSKKAAKKHELLFEKITPNAAASTSHTVSEIRQAYLDQDRILLDQLRLNRAVAQALEIIGKDPSIENLSKMKKALTCSILYMSYIFPMLTPYGHTYEQSGIITHLKSARQNPRDPLTGQPCSADQLIPNKAASQLIQLVYHYANSDQRKARIDYLKDKQEEILGELTGLVVSVDELPTKETAVQKKEKLIKKRVRLSMLTVGGGMLAKFGITLLLMLGIELLDEYYSPRSSVAKKTLPVLEMMTKMAMVRVMEFMRKDKITIFGWLYFLFHVASFFINAACKPICHRIESLNEQIDQLSNWINAGGQQAISALDHQIKALNELLEPEPQKPSPTAFFRNPHKRVKGVSSEAQPSADVMLAHR